MKKIITLALLVLTTGVTQAQNTDKAKKLLNEVAAKVKSYNNVVLDFTYTYNGNSNSGKVAIEGDKYVASLMGITQIYDGSKLYTINPEDEEITVSKNNGSDAVTPSKVLTFFNSGYTYSWDIQQKTGGKNIQYIKLKPTSSKSSTKEILLGIDSSAKQVYNKIEVFKNGSRSTLTVNSFKTNQSLGSGYFSFNSSKYPNYYINAID